MFKQQQQNITIQSNKVNSIKTIIIVIKKLT